MYINKWSAGVQDQMGGTLLLFFLIWFLLHERRNWAKSLHEWSPWWCWQLCSGSMNGQCPPDGRGSTQWFSLEYFHICSLHTTPTCSMLPASHLLPSRRPPTASCLCFISCPYYLRSSDMKTFRNLNVCALSTWREGSDQCLISSWSTVRIPLSLCCSVSGRSLRITLTVFLSCSCMLS